MGMKKCPSWTAYHRLGEKISKGLDSQMSFREIGDELGMTKQEAYHLCMVALGKLAYQARKTARTEA